MKFQRRCEMKKSALCIAVVMVLCISCENPFLAIKKEQKGYTSEALEPELGKANPIVDVWPTASAIIYGAALSSSTLTPSIADVPGNANVAGTFTWTNGATIPTVTNSGYSVTFTPDDTELYNSITHNIPITVSKADPPVTWPTNLVGTYTQPISSVLLTSYTNNPPGAFSWTTPDDPVGTLSSVGTTVSHNMTFTPTDTANYNTPNQNVDVLVVDKTVPTVTVWPTASAITYGATLSTSTLTPSTASVPGNANVAGTFAWKNGSIVPTVTNSGYEVTFTPSDTALYSTVDHTIPLTVNKATPTVTQWPTAATITYGPALSSSALTPVNASVPGNASVSGTFAWKNDATIPTVTNSGYPVTFTPTDSANYTTVEQNVAITVNKANPTVTVWPTASAVTFGAALSTSTLSGGAANVAGTFAWKNSATIPAVSNSGYPVTFTPTDTANYNTVEHDVAITVNMATPTVTQWPTAATITYGAALSTSALTPVIASVPGNASVSGTFAWTNGATIPTVTNNGYSVTFTPDDIVTYGTVTGNVNITVNKATPSPNWPTGLTAVVGQTLADVSLLSYTNDPPGPAGTFTWVTPSESVGDTAGTKVGQIRFYPSDTANYNDVSSTVNIEVMNKTIPTVSVWPTASAITYGATLSTSTLTPVNAAVPGNASVPGTFAWKNGSITPTVTNSGYEVTFTPTNTTLYSTVEHTIPLTVNKANPNVTTWPTASAVTYGAALSSSTLSGGLPPVPGTFDWKDDTIVPTVSNTGYPVTFTPTDTANYETVEQNVAITVNQATPTVTTWPTGATITYGAALSTSALTGGVASVSGTFTWTSGSTIPTVTNSGYSVTFTPDDTAAYGSVTGTGSITVNKADPTVTWPSNLTALVGQTLSNISLPGNGTATPSGTFTWTTPSASVGAAGTQSHNMTFTPTDAANYNTAAQNVNITVNKADPSVTWPTGLTAAAGQTLADISLASYTNTPAGTFSWTTPSTPVGSQGAQSHNMTFTPTDTANYNTVTNNVTVTVGKANPTVTWPTGLTAYYGQTLANISLPGNGTSTPAGTFTWTTPSTPVGSVGPQTHSMTFTPTDTANYNTVTNNNVPVTVQPIPEIEMVPISGGTFIMGSPPDEPDRETNETQHTVTLSSSFRMGKYEVTQEQYEAIMGTNPSWFIPAIGGPPATGETNARRPVERVTWYDAVEFCNKLSEIEGRQPVYTISGRTPATGYPITSATVTANWNTNGYRLPTEAQWEYACRAGTTTAYNTGATISDNTGWNMDNSVSKTHEVGLKPPNPFGLYDMHGNVYEWCWDWFGTYPGNGGTDPIGPSVSPDPSYPARVYRGGCFTESNYCRSAQRGSTSPINGFYSLGIRLVLPDESGKTNPTVTWPTNLTATVGQTLSNISLPGNGSGVPAGTFTWTAGGAISVGNAGTQAHSLTFTPSNTSYNAITGMVNVTVNKPNPTVTWPTGLTASYGQTLSAISLASYTNGGTGTFTWTNPSTSVGSLGTQTHNMTFTPNDTANYNTVTGNVNITVNKANPTVTWPTGLTATVGQTLSNISLPGNGSGTPAGTFSWTAGGATSVGNAGTQAHNMTFTPTDTTNYNTVAQNVNITVNRLTPTVTTWPTAATITYGATLWDSTLTGGSASVPGSFAWTSGNTRPTVINSGYAVTFYPTDNANYYAVAQTVSITVNKADPDVTWPTNLTGTYGDTLASIPLLPGNGGGTPVGTFTWTTPTDLVGPVGTQTHSVTFTPGTNPNYNTTPITNNVSITVRDILEIENGMVLLSGGTFTLGSSVSEPSHPYYAHPPHPVTLSPFRISKYEVTQAQYKAVMGSLPSEIILDWGLGSNHPMYDVNWFDAIIFCNRLSVAKGLTPAYRINGSTNPDDWGEMPNDYNHANYVTWGNPEIVTGSNGYRLPTEAQWEYACRAGTTTSFYTGDSLDPNAAWFFDNNNPNNNGNTTHGVGLKLPNAFGLYDMHGNVTEWVWDWFEMYPSDGAAETDPPGPVTTYAGMKMRRGGSVFSPNPSNRSYCRNYSLAAWYRGELTGFRVVRPAN